MKATQPSSMRRTAHLADLETWPEIIGNTFNRKIKEISERNLVLGLGLVDRTIAKERAICRDGKMSHSVIPNRTRK